MTPDNDRAQVLNQWLLTQPNLRGIIDDARKYQRILDQTKAETGTPVEHWADTIRAGDYYLHGNFHPDEWKVNGRPLSSYPGEFHGYFQSMIVPEGRGNNYLREIGLGSGPDQTFFGFEDLVRRRYWNPFLDKTREAPANFLFAWPSYNKGREDQTKFAYVALGARGDPAGRTTYPHFFFYLKPEDAQKFIEDIRKSPDLIEDIFQSIYPGLTSPDQLTRSKTQTLVLGQINRDFIKRYRDMAQFSMEKLPLEELQFSYPVGES